MPKRVAQGWRTLAKKYHIKQASIERMRPAFALTEEALT